MAEGKRNIFKFLFWCLLGFGAVVGLGFLWFLSELKKGVSAGTTALAVQAIYWHTGNSDAFGGMEAITESIQGASSWPASALAVSMVEGAGAVPTATSPPQAATTGNLGKAVGITNGTQGSPESGGSGGLNLGNIEGDVEDVAGIAALL